MSDSGSHSATIEQTLSSQDTSEMKLPIPSTVLVVKRNGMLVPFSRDRIYRAIELAFRDTKRISSEGPIPVETRQIIEHITYLVTQELARKSLEGGALTVEGIQDIVEIKLMETGHLDVARDYIIYRNEHKAWREGSPQHLKIIRRAGEPPVRFNPIKIASCLEDLFREVHQVRGSSPPLVIDSVNDLTQKVVQFACEQAASGTILRTELIQDAIERLLMSAGHFDLAKHYILHRHSKPVRGSEPEQMISEAILHEVIVDVSAPRIFKGTGPEGDFSFDEHEVRQKLEYAAQGLPTVQVSELLELTVCNFYDGIRKEEIDQAYLMAARSKIESDPSYSKVAARLLLDTLYQDLLQLSAAETGLSQAYRGYLKTYISYAISIHRVDPRLMDFDFAKLSAALCPERDLLFSYLGLQTLFDRYFIHEQQRRLELPQVFWMRVAMGLALNEGTDRTDRAIQFYNMISRFLYCPGTPTLFNSGTNHSQLSSCYLSTIHDDLAHIFKVIADDAQLSKWAGGIGNDWTPVRATGALIQGTNGTSQGIIPFLKVANDTAVAVNQGGKRKGAMCAYLETWHLDIEDFLELRKNTGDERRRTHDMNTANWIPDLFMKRVSEGGLWTLFSPSDVPDLHDLFGAAFDARYEEYEAQAKEGRFRLYKQVEALTLWRKMLSMLFETGHPWITFKDPSNLRSPQQHAGVVHSSNLCTEILLNTSATETAVCNLGSINLPLHTTSKGLDLELLQSTIFTAMRMLDNVIDINFYPTIEAKHSNLQHRPVGLGFMGFQDSLYIQGLSYASPEAVDFADTSMEAISYFAILASSTLAKERGYYSSYKGSLWDQGCLPIDSVGLVKAHRGEAFCLMDHSQRMDWSPVRESIRLYGMRNSNTMAIAPTATISNITGVAQSIEPTYKNLYVKSNLSGEFTIPNSYLVDALKARGLWDAEMLDDLKYFDGSVLEIARIPEDLKQIFLTAFEIEPEWIIECGSRRQKWIDMGQSLNLYVAEPSGKKLHDMYMLAWLKGLKTTYYLRTLGATQIEKSTTDVNKRGLQPRWMKNRSASSNIQVQREACTLGEACESCQ